MVPSSFGEKQRVSPKTGKRRELKMFERFDDDEEEEEEENDVKKTTTISRSSAAIANGGIGFCVVVDVVVSSLIVFLAVLVIRNDAHRGVGSLNSNTFNNNALNDECECYSRSRIKAIVNTRSRRRTVKSRTPGSRKDTSYRPRRRSQVRRRSSFKSSFRK